MMKGRQRRQRWWWHRWSSKIVWLWKLQRTTSDPCGKLQREDMDGVCAHMAREGGGEAATVMQLGTVEFCDPSRVGNDACCKCYGRDRVVDEEDGSRGKSRGGSERQQRVMQTTMLAATEGKKGNDSDREEAALGHMAAVVGGEVDDCYSEYGEKP
ncbi:hypothetical protein B296_00033879 [Ensete ventricosum]|uniref:Uncharacterized protein n=1 Tax=Ensete ventricosum TaxID=4639 RepID=A0A426XYK1_ENSVE|nr:hypothetical protein B296_00033879 [Ensete ventricosum]